jgi:phospholipid/cholesterol/gamma-HCH transport system ATP-binding protein
MEKAAVRVDHISKSFDGRAVLDDVSFEVAAGEAFCLLGRSGTGKSVMLKLMVGLLPVDSGSITMASEEMQKLDRPELMRVRKKVGFLFQSAALFDSVTLAENLAFPLRRHTEKSEAEIQDVVRSKLSDVGLEEDGGKMPSDLSGGMRKRAGLARALVLDPEILLVDEPSSGLDRVTAGEIYDLLLRMKERKKTLVVVTHDAAGSRRFADRMGLLDEGKIAVSGTPEELAKGDNELARALVGGANT